MDGGSLQSFAYQFDPQMGNLTTRQDLIHNQTETFSYDALGRLTGIGIAQ
jgi:YD repeat-containing protein